MAKKEINKEKNKSNFFKELKSELKKVTWPTFKKLVNNTSAVISIVIILAAIVFVLDVCFENLNKFGVGTLKQIVSSSTENVEETAEGNSNEAEQEIDVNLETEGESTEQEETDAAAQTENSSEAEVVQE